MKDLVKKIVSDAERLKDKYTDRKSVLVNYACIFCHSEKEQEAFLAEAGKLGNTIMETSTGPIFHVQIETVAGKLQLLKIRKPDSSRAERGDADFTISDFDSFKNEYLKLPNFSLIKREDYEMIELSEPGADVRVYFSSKPLDAELNLV